MLELKAKIKFGFTLVEMVVTITILSILTAVALPSIYSFVQSGKQINRTNIARTIYVAAQDQLTQKKLSKTLLSFSQEAGFYDADGKLNEINKVYAISGLNPPADDLENADYVRYISLDKSDTINENNPVVKLLDPVVVNKNILKSSICIEYNIQTGVVLSVFYSDIADHLIYGGGEEKEDLLGDRPYDFAMAKDRKQGYYGGYSTGEEDIAAVPDKIAIYDGVNQPLVESNASYENVLYGEILVPKNAAKYDLQLFDINKNYKISREVEVDFADNQFMLTNVLSEAKKFPYKGQDIIYRTANPQGIIENGVDVSNSYHKYIWLIDYAGGDMIKDSGRYSIVENYKNADGSPLQPQNLRMAMKKDDMANYSSNSFSVHYAHSHFSGSTITFQSPIQGLADNPETVVPIYYLQTGRHLNNIRYLPDGKYRQTSTIDLQKDSFPIDNFQPIQDFSGEYRVLLDDVAIKNLIIKIDGATLSSDKPQPSAVGLFANLKSKGKIDGISLLNAQITAANLGGADSGGVFSLGSLVGYLEDGIISRCSTLARVLVDNIQDRKIYIGGMVGFVSDQSRVDRSYNGGFFDALSKSKSAEGFGSVSLRGNYSADQTVLVGGLAGFNGGLIKNVYNNARVNIEDLQVKQGMSSLKNNPWDSYAPLMAKNAGLGGIAGGNSGQIASAYATNLLAQYEDCLSGGIVGLNEASDSAISNSYYLGNGCGDKTVISKMELREKDKFPSNA
ncbi:MAG: type II secretion system protein, partial [Clostridiales bacterium]